METKHRRTRWPALAAALCLALMTLLSACGSGSSPDYGGMTNAAEAPTAMPEEAMYDSAAQTALEGGGPSLTLPQDDRKVIITAYINIEALDFTATCTELQQAVAGCGGYVSATDIQGGDYPGSRWATFTMRVPAEKYTDFIQLVEKSGNMTSRNESSEDVTDQYVDIESRLKTLRAEEEWLLEAMEVATNVEELIELRDRLTDVQYNIEYITGGKRQLDNLTAYSTVNINVYEVVEYTEPPKETYGQQVGSTFRNAWRVTGEVFKSIWLFLVAIHPFLIFCGVVLIIVFAIIKIVKKARANRPPKPEKPKPMPPPRPPMGPPMGPPPYPMAGPGPGAPPPPMPPQPAKGGSGAPDAAAPKPETEK